MSEIYEIKIDGRVACATEDPIESIHQEEAIEGAFDAMDIYWSIHRATEYSDNMDVIFSCQYTTDRV